jgi:murein DD-endopeptidase MepM/ murein hydrolase activator NlpD
VGGQRFTSHPKAGGFLVPKEERMFSIDPRTGRRLVGRFIFNRDGGNDGGGGGGGGADVLAAFQSRLEKMNGNAQAFAQQLYSENAELRAKRREAEAERDALKAKVPTEGSVVLSGDDAKLFAELTAKVPLKDAKDKLAAAETATGKLADYERRELIQQVAEAHGFKANVLERLAKTDGITLALDREIERDDGKGGKTKVKVATVKDASGQTLPLEEYAQKNWADFQPALTAQGGGQQGNPGGLTFVAQRGSGDAPRSSPKSEPELVQEQIRTTPNPF